MLRPYSSTDQLTRFLYDFPAVKLTNSFQLPVALILFNSSRFKCRNFGKQRIKADNIVEVCSVQKRQLIAHSGGLYPPKRLASIGAEKGSFSFLS